MYSANPAAVTYGDWQISQAYQATGDFNKALEYGDKALAGTPRNLDILVSQGSIAQQAKNNSKLMEYVAKGGMVCGSIEKQPKPDGMSDDDFKRPSSGRQKCGAEQLRFSGVGRLQRDRQLQRPQEPNGIYRGVLGRIPRFEVSGAGL